MRAYLPLVTACLLLGSAFVLSPVTAGPTHAAVHAKTKHALHHHAKPAKHQTARKSKKHAQHHHKHATARRHRHHGIAPQPNRVGLLLPLDSPLGKAVVERPGTITIVRQAAGNADFLEGGTPQYNTLTGMDMETASNGPAVHAIGYFSLTMPPETELRDFNLIQELPPMLNTATGQVERYGEFVARTDITNPHIWAKLGKEHAARAAAQKNARRQHQPQQKQTAKKGSSQHQGRAEKHSPAQQFVARRPYPAFRRPATHLLHAPHAPHHAVR